MHISWTRVLDSLHFTHVFIAEMKVKHTPLIHFNDPSSAVFTGSQDIAQPFTKVPQRPVDPCLMYPKDPQSCHQAAVTSMCHVQVVCSGTEHFLLLLPEPGTDYQFQFHATVQAKTVNIFIYCWAPELNCKLNYVMCPRSAVARCRWHTINTDCIILYWSKDILQQGFQGLISHYVSKQGAHNHNDDGNAISK